MHTAQSRSSNATGRHQAGRDGFTLMEVALAILVVAIGVMAVFSLLASGMDSNTKAMADTQATIFADNVFNALSAAAQKRALDNPGDPKAWITYWTDLKAGKVGITLSAEPAWQNAVSFSKSGVGAWTTDSGVAKVKATDRSFRRIDFPNSVFTGHPRGGLQQDGKTLLNHSVRYQFTVTPLATPPEKGTVLLLVWPGKYGSLEPTDAVVFYSEFINRGTL